MTVGCEVSTVFGESLSCKGFTSINVFEPIDTSKINDPISNMEDYESQVKHDFTKGMRVNAKSYPVPVTSNTIKHQSYSPLFHLLPWAVRCVCSVSVTVYYAALCYKLAGNGTTRNRKPFAMMIPGALLRRTSSSNSADVFDFSSATTLIDSTANRYKRIINSSKSTEHGSSARIESTEKVNINAFAITTYENFTNIIQLDLMSRFKCLTTTVVTKTNVYNIDVLLELSVLLVMNLVYKFRWIQEFIKEKPYDNRTIIEVLDPIADILYYLSSVLDGQATQSYKINRLAVLPDLQKLVGRPLYRPNGVSFDNFMLRKVRPQIMSNFFHAVGLTYSSSSEKACLMLGPVLNCCPSTYHKDPEEYSLCTSCYNVKKRNESCCKGITLVPFSNRRKIDACVAKYYNTLDEDQKYVVNAICRLTHKNFCVIAAGGAGKTYVLTLIILMRKLHLGCRSAITVSMTSKVARRIGGSTLHSLLMIPPIADNMFSNPEAVVTLVVDRLRSKDNTDRYWNIRYYLVEILFDEISQLSRVLIWIYHRVLQEIKENSDWFGGVRQVYFGDTSQLPAIATSWNDFQSEQYSAPYSQEKGNQFYNSEAYYKSDFQHLLLWDQHRCPNQDLMTISQKLRYTDGSNLNNITAGDIEFLNNCGQSISRAVVEHSLDAHYHSLKAQVQAINSAMDAGPYYRFKAKLCKHHENSVFSLLVSFEDNRDVGSWFVTIKGIEEWHKLVKEDLDKRSLKQSTIDDIDYSQTTVFCLENRDACALNDSIVEHQCRLKPSTSSSSIVVEAKDTFIRYGNYGNQSSASTTQCRFRCNHTFAEKLSLFVGCDVLFKKNFNGMYSNNDPGVVTGITKSSGGDVMSITVMHQLTGLSFNLTRQIDEVPPQSSTFINIIYLLLPHQSHHQSITITSVIIVSTLSIRNIIIAYIITPSAYYHHINHHLLLGTLLLFRSTDL